MTKNQEIARGVGKGERFAANDKWRSVAGDLNAVGPPYKNVNSWKKVFTINFQFIYILTSISIHRFGRIGRYP